MALEIILMTLAICALCLLWYLWGYRNGQKTTPIEKVIYINCTLDEFVAKFKENQNK